MLAEAEPPKYVYSRTNDDPLYWAGEDREWSAWIRENAHFFKLNGESIDGSKVVLGMALSNICGDDGNCFGKSTGYIPEHAEENRLSIIERLDWEGTVTELPQGILTHVVNLRDKFSRMSFGKESWFYYARFEYIKLRDFTMRAIQENPDLFDACQYYFETNGVLNKEIYDDIEQNAQQIYE